MESELRKHSIVDFNFTWLIADWPAPLAVGFVVVVVDSVVLPVTVVVVADVTVGLLSIGLFSAGLMSIGAVPAKASGVWSGEDGCDWVEDVEAGTEIENIIYHRKDHDELIYHHK